MEKSAPISNQITCVRNCLHSRQIWGLQVEGKRRANSISFENARVCSRVGD